jgi:hypothetical protein
MSVESFNTIELRYADSVLAAHRFVKLEDYEKEKAFSQKMMDKAIKLVRENTNLKVGVLILAEEDEILRAERTHWHNMYNAESAPDVEG